MQFFTAQFRESPQTELRYGSRVEVYAERKVWAGKVTGIVTDSSNELFYRVNFDGAQFSDDLRVKNTISIE